MLLLGRAAAAHHKLPLRPTDVVVMSRPDVLFNRPVVGARLHAAAWSCVGRSSPQAQARFARVS